MVGHEMGTGAQTKGQCFIPVLRLRRHDPPTIFRPLIASTFYVPQTPDFSKSPTDRAL
jgi:hypothetical protein